MSSKLDWGIAESASIARERYVVNDGGYRLFYISDDQVAFPEKDFRVWPWTRLSTVGWINTNPTALTIEGTYLLTAKDEHKFFWAVSLTLQLKGRRQDWETVARTQQGLQTLIESIVEEVGRSHARSYQYSSISDEEPDMVEVVTGEIVSQIEAGTPYRVLRCRFEVAAEDPALDDAMAQTRRVFALDRERARADDIVRADTQRARIDEVDEHRYRQALSREQSEMRRNEESRDQQHQLRLRAQEAELERKIDTKAAEAQAKVLGQLVSIFGGDATRAVLSRHPELLAKIALGEIEVQAKTGSITYKTGVADGSIRAINALLRGHDLSEHEQVVRIINQDGGTTRKADDSDTSE